MNNLLIIHNDAKVSISTAVHKINKQIVFEIISDVDVLYHFQEIMVLLKDLFECM